jgi:prepilin-type processing-associated H-X9-DG protein
MATPTSPRSLKSSVYQQIARIGQAIALYVQDNAGFLPSAEPAPRIDPNDPKRTIDTCHWARWHTALVGPGYLPGFADRFTTGAPATVFRCPADRTALPDQGVDQSSVGTSYLVNNRVLPFHSTGGAGGGPFRYAKYKNPADRLVLTEKDASLRAVHAGLIEPWNQDPILTGLRGRHGLGGADGAANVLFLDFHVETRTLKHITAPAQLAKQKHPDPDPRNLWGTRPEE